MAKVKEITARIKLQVPGGQATPAPPVGPALGQHGVNIGEFVSKFNEATKNANGMTTPVEITVYKDRTFTFIIKSPPASVLLKQAAAIAKGAAGTEQVGTVTRSQVMDIVRMKKDVLNHVSDEAGFRIIAGTARSMGITVAEDAAS